MLLVVVFLRRTIKVMFVCMGSGQIINETNGYVCPYVLKRFMDTFRLECFSLTWLKPTLKLVQNHIHIYTRSHQNDWRRQVRGTISRGPISSTKTTQETVVTMTMTKTKTISHDTSTMLWCWHRNTTLWRYWGCPLEHTWTLALGASGP